MMDTRILRERQADALAAADRLAGFAHDGGVAILVQTTAVSAYPTTAGACYGCNPVLVDGLENEGAAASFTADSTRTLYAFNVGSQLPPVGTIVIAHASGGRWAFRYDG